MRRWAMLALVFAGLCLLAAHSHGQEIYQWVDERGRVHMTDDLSQVPRDQRPDAERDLSGSDTTRGWNDVNIPPPAAPAVARFAAPAAAGAQGEEPAGRRHVLGVQRAGSEIRVLATLNGSVGWPYVVDTGATLNTIPRAAAERLGLVIDEDTPTTVVAGIGGTGMKVPVVTVRSVQIGSATVENVEMAVLDTMSTGLLGMPFFNNFRVALDPTRGTLVLEEVDINSVDGVFGGLDQSAWRQQFRLVRFQLAQVREQLERMPGENVAQVEDLKEQEAHWSDQLRQLDLKATRAGVPRAWRE